MKITNTLKKQKGFTAIELMIVVPIAFFLIYLFVRPTLGLAGFSKSSEIQAHFTELRTGALAYRAQAGVCTGVSVAELVSRGLLNSDWATLTNPWGGSYTVSCAGSNVTQFSLSTSGVADDAIGRQVAGAYSNKVISSSYASGTINLVIQG